MNDKFKRFAFYNIFFLCAFIGLFMVLNLKSFANNNFVFQYKTGAIADPITTQYVCSGDSNSRYCLYKTETSGFYNYVLYSNSNIIVSYVNYITTGYVINIRNYNI